MNSDDAQGEPSYQPTERRPIASRETGWARSIASRLAANGVSPNAISVAGMLAAIAAGGCLAATAQTEGWLTRGCWLAAALFAQCRLLANLFDGMVAIERNLASPVGELYNEVPDRVSDAAIFIGLGYAVGGCPILGLTAALVCVFTAYVRAAAKVAGAPQDYCGPMAKPQRMATVTLVALYAALAPLAWQPIYQPGDTPLGIAALGLAIVIVGGFFTALRRLWRAGRFLRSSSARTP